MRLILNRIKTPDGTILTSYHTHDFVMHTDKNGQQYGVDGGLSYSRRIGNTNECEDLSVWVNEDGLIFDINKNLLSKEESYEIIRESIHWGSRGKDGRQPLKQVKLSEMTDEHLNALLHIYKGPINEYYKECFIQEVEYRTKLGLTITEQTTI